MPGKIPRPFIDQLLARTDIVDVIERHVPLTKAGKEYQARCPFHEEKTPSFTVSPAKQFYHCFGCGAHGNAIGFLMEYANLGFVEAVEQLAATAGIPVPYETPSGKPTTQKSDPAIPQITALVDQANRWFQQQLRQHPEAKQAIAYLKQRGVDGETAAEFQLGYAPSGWTNLTTALATDPTRRRQLQTAGLLTQRDTAKNEYYDRFRSRITFPIEDHRGQVVAFGGRIIGDEEPKYLNSPQTPIFNKGAGLYNLHRARRPIADANHSIVVEGYMDVLSLAQFGARNAVATMGTATTPAHIVRLFRLAPKIVFCFDGDRAGTDAAWKAMQATLPEMRAGRQAHFLFLPQGEDPDTLIRREGHAAFTQRIATAEPLSDFLFRHLAEQIDGKTQESRAQLINLATPLLAQLPPGPLQDTMYKKLAQTTGINEPDLRRATPQPNPTPPRHNRNRTQPPPANFPTGQLSPTALAISLLLQNPTLATTAPPHLLKNLQTLYPQPETTPETETEPPTPTPELRGATILLRLLKAITTDPTTTTARLIELYRDTPTHPHLQHLATRPHLIAPEAQPTQFNDTLTRLLTQHQAHQRQTHIDQLILEQLRHPQGSPKQRQLKQQINQLLAQKHTNTTPD